MSKTALIIIDHGSQMAAANEMLEKVVALVRRKAGGDFSAIETAHMELAEPSLQAAFDRCVAAGAQTVIISLFFLSPGRHSTADIPRMAAEAAAAHPGVEVHVTEPMGVDDRLAEVLLARVKATSGGPAPAPGP